MFIVVDANVLCAGLLAKGKTAELLFSPKIKPVAPERLFTEIENHRVELLEKSKLSKVEFDTLLALYKKYVKIVPEEDFKDMLKKANELLGEHVKDTAYVALALQFNCPLWSKEKRLKAVDELEVYDAEELGERIG